MKALPRLIKKECVNCDERTWCKLRFDDTVIWDSRKRTYIHVNRWFE